MKMSLYLPLALGVLIALVAIPAGPRSERTPQLRADLDAYGPMLHGTTGSGEPCRLLVEVGPRTTFDRGTLASLESGDIDAGSFRYWEESSGPVLYVYDDVQNLRGRILNPVSVRVEAR